jgi:hypothetical protein
MSYPEHWMVGMGIRSSTSGDTIPILLFTPVPGSKSQIFESRKYFVVCGKYTSGAMVDANQFSEPLMVDFTVNSASVTIVHETSGNMVIQKRED